ncbi:MAG: alpha/beta hydrolase [Candidatus Eremiobacteraeota bacterium]|nr:alpha/beta hydrolase [Candidatus Eremiobacteraeota bacterium]
MFEGFARKRLPGTDGVEINAVVGGSGPPLLLLHGYPQTHAMWHKVAPALAGHFTVVAADLRGYGDSSKPPSDPSHLVYSKRSTANDLVAAMDSLGFKRFRVAGHDRGGRVAHRMALDHPDAIERIAVLDIAPTREMFRATTFDFAMAYYHWFFLAQPFDYPERLIGADPEYYLRRKIKAWSGSGAEGVFAPEALAEYVRCFRDPKTIHASCEDYRAAATIDIEHDDADGAKKIKAPLLAYWGAKGVIERLFDAVALWRLRAEDVRGETAPTAHYLAEEAPEPVASRLLAFFT